MEAPTLHLSRILTPLTSVFPHGNVLALSEYVSGIFGAELHLLLKDMAQRNEPDKRYLWMMAEAEDANRPPDPKGPATPTDQKPTVIHEHIEWTANTGVIAEYALNHDVGLIIQETFGHTVLGKTVFGGLASEMVRYAPCPVMSVRKRIDGPALMPVERLMVCVDFSDASAPAVRFAHELAGRFGAQLHVVHVLAPPAYPWFPLSVTQPARAAEEAHAVEQDVQDALAALCAEAGIPEGACTGAVRIGQPADELIAYATSNRIDIIVCPKYGLGESEPDALGSTADRVMRKAPRGVLTADRTFLERFKA